MATRRPSSAAQFQVADEHAPVARQVVEESFIAGRPSFGRELDAVKMLGFDTSATRPFLFFQGDTMKMQRKHSLVYLAALCATLGMASGAHADWFYDFQTAP